MRRVVTLATYSDGPFEIDAAHGNGTVVRGPSSTTITGTATQGSGSYAVDVTL